MDKPTAAYKGAEAYVFACYAHVDSGMVFDDLVQLNNQGVNIWYDEGIQAGSSWRAEIASAITGASKFLFFISEASLASAHCLREVDYALSNNIPIIPIYLDESKLPPELDLALNRVQALFREDDSRYTEHLLDALRKGPGLTSVTARQKSNPMSLVTILAVIAIAVFLIFNWQKGKSVASDGIQSTETVATPSAFEPYLEGMELMERWDKDDNLEAAISKYREAIEADPDFALAYARLAGALRWQYALTRESAVLDEAVDNINVALSINPDLAPVQTALGRIQITQGNMDLAQNALEKAVSIDPNDATANSAVGRLYERLGRMEDAEAAFLKSISLDPEDLRNIDAFANFLYDRGRYEDAALQWQKILEIAPDHYSVLINLGSVFNEMGNVGAAIELYKRAIEIKASYMAWSNLGTAASRAHRYEEAVSAYKKALEIDDSDWLVWGNLAYVYSWQSGMNEVTTETFQHAIALAEAARQNNQRDIYAHSDLALYYAKTGETELALQRVSTALSLSPESGEILAAAAEVHLLVGQRDKALELVRESLELGYPLHQYQNNPEFSQLLAEVSF